MSSNLYPQVTILYDTCYLMNSGEIPEFDPVKINVGRMCIQHVIATEIKGEIGKLMISPEKSESARKARTLCSRIMSKSDYVEISLANIQPVEINEKILGPDSEVDKKLLGEALRRLGDDPRNIVYIATHDGGIRCEAAFLQSVRGLNIFTPSSEAKFRERVEEAYPPYYR